MRICTPLAPFYTIYGALNKANELPMSISHQ